MFDAEKKDIRRDIAACLGLDDEDPASWPDEMIDHIIREMERSAERARNEAVTKLLIRR